MIYRDGINKPKSAKGINFKCLCGPLTLASLSWSGIKEQGKKRKRPTL
jgi:hypothetical protein